MAVSSIAAGGRVAEADVEDELVATQAAVDETAERWFDAQSDSATLNAEIETLELDLAELRSAAQKTRGSARVQASALYETSSSGRETSSLFEGSSAMEASRRTELLTQINQLARDDLEAHARLVGDARDRLADLEARRAELDQTLERLAAEEAELQRRLARAQQAYRAQQAAERAAELAAQARANDAASESDDGGASSETDSTEPGTTEPDDSDPPDEPDEVDPPSPPEPGQHRAHNDPFLSCVRQRESRGDYTVVNWKGPWYGAYQFAAGTWNATASHAGRPELIGVLPHRASPWDQDDLAWVLYQWQGKGPWGGGCG